MLRTDIAGWAESKWGFYVDRHFDAERGHWRHVRGPIQLAEYHGRILAHCFRLDDEGRLPYDTVAICEPAKSGKTAISALVHEWFALHVEPPAEQYVISNKRDQAQSRAFKALCESVRWNPHLKRQPNKYELKLGNHTTVKAIPCNYRGEAGARFTLASFDEPWGIMYTDGERLVSEFKPDPTRTVSCRLFTGYAGFTGESHLWADLLQHGLDGQPVDELRDIEDGRGQPACWRNGRTFVFWSHVPRQPWQTKRWLSSLEGALTPGEYARMVFCDFSASEESYVQEASWDACYDPALPPLQPGDRTPLVIGLDASVSGDCSALIVVSRHPKRPQDVAVRLCHIWNPAKLGGQVVQSETIEPALLQLIRNYAVACCSYDEYQLAKLVQDLQRAGTSCWFHKFPQTQLRMVADAKLRQLIIARRVAHDGNPLLRAHVAVNAAARVSGENRLRIVKKSRGAHVDAAVALSMAAYQVLHLNL